ncbi:MAG TPA: hypothetical protein VFW70_19195 [Methylomirabilota bacterium]|nr:hypothetical protein [Methylomirabilota bacterium]
MRRWIAAGALPAAAFVLLAAAPARAIDRDEIMRPCKRHDLIGIWRVLRLGVNGAPVDKSDPAFLPHQRYVFHANATMLHATQEVPFTAQEQRELITAPSSATWALETEGRLVRQRDGVAAVEKADCRVLLRAVKDPKTSQPTARAGDILLTEESADAGPSARRLLRRIRVAVD